MIMNWQFNTPDLPSTQHLGRQLGVCLFPGSVIALIGPLGAGKTALVRAIAEGLDIEDSRQVTSPTFVLMQEYAARLPITHVDVYRLRSAAEFLDLGPEEWLGGPGVCLIEWADRVLDELPTEHMAVHIRTLTPDARQWQFQANGARHREALACLVQRMQTEGRA